MKPLLIAACAAAAATTAPVLAQDAHAGHAPATQAAAAPIAAARLNLDTPVETIVADATGKAVLEANLPGVTTHEHYAMFKSMGLRQIHAMAPAQLPADKLAKIESELAAIK